MFLDTQMRADAPYFAESLEAEFGDELQAGTVGHNHWQAEPVPPTRDQFTQLLTQGHIDTAIALFHAFHQSQPDRVTFEEAQVNVLGYRLLQSGDLETAIKVFKMNTLVYPHSANTWDSLSDGYLATGDNEKAIECMRKVLEVLPDDTVNSEQLKEQIRVKCENTLQELGG
jgi:tetratricopeptide (TPR) repeat protein